MVCHHGIFSFELNPYPLGHEASAVPLSCHDTPIKFLSFNTVVFLVYRVDHQVHLGVLMLLMGLYLFHLNVFAFGKFKINCAFSNCVPSKEWMVRCMVKSRDVTKRKKIRIRQSRIFFKKSVRIGSDPDFFHVICCPVLYCFICDMLPVHFSVYARLVAGRISVYTASAAGAAGGPPQC